jgi:hypothetical protein
MQHLFRNPVVALGLILAGATATAAQLDTPFACCLASEWKVIAEEPSAQTSGHFCCIANEWQAEPEPSASDAAVKAAQSDQVSCCLAREWDAS